MNRTSLISRGVVFLNQTFLALLVLHASLLSASADLWEQRASVPGARAAHSAVWTGREMIVWGGGIDGSFLNTGGRYLPATDAWRTTALSNAPSPRWFHAAVWTGREMLIWGGRANFFGDDNYDTGARYNPETDSWSPMPNQGAPTRRSQCAAVWTGTEMIVWGGATEGGVELNDGGRYNPETDTWSPISNASGLEPRMEPTGIWTGEELIVFGGMKFTGGQLSFADGARYNPATDRWTPLPGDGAPGSRTEHTAVWTGERMIVWGGRVMPAYQTLNDGAIYSPASDTWTPISALGAPSARMLHAAVWSGSEMIIWGGQEGESGVLLNTGARYNPATGVWTAMTQEQAPGERMFWRPDLGIWTGSGMLVCAGSDYPASLDSTFLYRKDGTNAPPPPPNTVYDVSTGFSLTANPSGPWSYGYSTGLQGNFSLLGAPRTFSADNGVPIAIWAFALYQKPWVAKVLGPGTAVSDGGRFTAPAGTIYFGPDPDAMPEDFGVIRFTVPAGGGGLYRLETTVHSLYDTTRSVDADFHVLRNRQELFGQIVPPNSGATYSNLVALAALDTVDFAAGRGPNGLPDTGLKIQATLILVSSNVSPPLCVVPASGLVGWWAGEGNARDRAGGNDGIVQDGVTFQPGEVGQAFALAGQLPGIHIPAAPSLDVGAGAGMSIELWINPDDVTQPGPLVEWNNGIDLFGAHFWILPNQSGEGLQPPSTAVAGPGQLYAAFTLTGQWYQMITDAGVLTPHEFQHVAVTYDKSTGVGRIFRNGAQVAEQGLGTFTPQTAFDLYLGLRPAAPPGNPLQAYHGLMDEVSVYNRALTAVEIADIYQSGAAGKCRTEAGSIEQLIALINAAQEIENKEPLLASLNAARASFARGNTLAEINQLRAFQNKVRASLAKVDTELATQLNDIAEEIINSVDPAHEYRIELDGMQGMPLKLARAFQMPAAGLCVEGCAVPGTLCRIQRSTNLRDWADVGAPLEVSDGLYQFLETSPTGSSTFYRFRAQ